MGSREMGTTNFIDVCGEDHNPAHMIVVFTCCSSGHLQSLSDVKVTEHGSLSANRCVHVDD